MDPYITRSISYMSEWGQATLRGGYAFRAPFRESHQIDFIGGNIWEMLAVFF